MKREKAFERLIYQSMMVSPLENSQEERKLRMLEPKASLILIPTQLLHSTGEKKLDMTQDQQ